MNHWYWTSSCEEAMEAQQGRPGFTQRTPAFQGEEEIAYPDGWPTAPKKPNDGIREARFSKCRGCGVVLERKQRCRNKGYCDACLDAKSQAIFAAMPPDELLAMQREEARINKTTEALRAYHRRRAIAGKIE